MEELLRKLETLEMKLGALLKQHTEIKEENKKLTERNQKLYQNKIDQEKKINELQKHITLLKVSSSVHTISGPEDSKEKIDELVREINECIALLKK
jgi:hypothetical protein